MGSYRNQIAGRDYEVTPDQKAAHRHILENVVPTRKDLADLVSFLDQHGAVDPNEAEKLREAVRVLDGLCIPMALLKEVEDPRSAAAARMFSGMLRSRKATEQEAPEEADSPPSMRT